MKSKTLHPHRIGLADPAEGGYGKIDHRAGDAKFCREIVERSTEPIRQQSHRNP